MRKIMRFRSPAILMCCLWVAAICSSAHAEVVDTGGPVMRLRVGPSGQVATVIYEAGIPGEFGGLPGVTAAPNTVSANIISGGNGNGFTVRIVTQANARGGASSAPFTGSFFFDSSSPLDCSTAATCGSESISFETISWTVSDGDTHQLESAFDGNPGLKFQEQTDLNNAVNGTDNRHRNWYKFEYDNQTLLPAGTYEGTVIVSGEES